MKSILFGFVAVLSFVAAFTVSKAEAAEKPMWRCECAPAVPFEGFQIYAIETIDGKESWMLLESRASQYDDAVSCGAAIAEEKVCQDFILL